MKIISVTDYTVTCEHLTVGAAIKNLSTYYVDCETRVDSYADWRAGRILGDSSHDLTLILEVGYPQHARMSTKDVKRLFPNAKLVTMACDTLWYLAENIEFQWDSPHDYDLCLESMSETYEYYKKKIDVPVDIWRWTTSDTLLETCRRYVQDDAPVFAPKDYDFIGVYHPCSIEKPGSYRQGMFKYIRDQGWTFTQGGGSGHNDNDNFRNLLKQYAKSWFTLGTTSHNDPRMYGMKGFRDWIGPELGAVLVYDDYKDVIEYFGGKNLLPLYKYGDFAGLLELCDNLKKNRDEYAYYLETQRKWAWRHTIEKQLVKLLDKHKIIPTDRIRPEKTFLVRDSH